MSALALAAPVIFSPLLLVFAGLAFRYGYNSRRKLDKDSLAAAQSIATMTGQMADRVLDAARVVSRTDADLVVMSAQLAEANKQLAKYNEVLDRLDANQGSMLNVMFNSGMFSRSEIADLQRGERTQKPADADEVPPPFPTRERSVTREGGEVVMR